MIVELGELEKTSLTSKNSGRQSSGLAELKNLVNNRPNAKVLAENYAKPYNFHKDHANVNKDLGKLAPMYFPTTESGVSASTAPLVGFKKELLTTPYETGRNSMSNGNYIKEFVMLGPVYIILDCRYLPSQDNTRGKLLETNSKDSLEKLPNIPKEPTESIYDDKLAPLVS